MMMFKPHLYFVNSIELVWHAHTNDKAPSALTEKDKKKAIEWLCSNGKHLKVERHGNSYAVKSIKRRRQVINSGLKW